MALTQVNRLLKGIFIAVAWFVATGIILELLTRMVGESVDAAGKAIWITSILLSGSLGGGLVGEGSVEFVEYLHRKPVIKYDDDYLEFKYQEYMRKRRFWRWVIGIPATIIIILIIMASINQLARQLPGILERAHEPQQQQSGTNDPASSQAGAPADAASP
jgi:MFS family permease